MSTAKTSLDVSQQKAVYGEAFDPSTPDIAVVELSATWCGPCIRAVPHLNDIQTKFPEVKILSIFADPASKIRAAIPNETKYVISVVAGETFQDWCKLLDTSGIPHAAILKKGEVVWKGHPGTPDFEATLTKLTKKD